MSKALIWIRKSKGSDDDIGLEDQRENVKALADELADERDALDFGVHTGFSTLTRDDSAGLIDQNPQVTEVVERLRKGEYDYLVAWDDRRVCRDEYYAVIKHACEQGGAELVFVENGTDDELTHDIRRRIERATKEEEIQKAKRALERRRENGFDEGRPKFGFKYDDDGKYQIPDPETFSLALQVIKLRNDGKTYAAIEDETGIAQGTINNILDRREVYLEYADKKRSTG